MTRRGARILVSQVVIVLALLLVVYLTLLRPESHQPLFGIGTSTGAGQIAQSGGPGTGASQAILGPGGRGGHGRGHRRGRGGGSRGAVAPQFGATSASVTQAAATADGLPGRDGAEEGLTPTQDQYGDAIGQMFGRL